MERLKLIEHEIISCVVASYNEPLPEFAVVEHCANLHYPEWTREEVEQIGTRALNAVRSMLVPRERECL